MARKAVYAIASLTSLIAVGGFRFRQARGKKETCDVMPTLHQARITGTPANEFASDSDSQAYHRMVEQVSNMVGRPSDTLYQTFSLTHGHFMFPKTSDPYSVYNPSLYVWNESLPSWRTLEIEDGFLSLVEPGVYDKRLIANNVDAANCNLRVDEEIMVFRNWFGHRWQYGHRIHDHLPMIIDIYNHMPVEARIVVEADVENKSSAFFEFVDPNLFRKILWVREGDHVCSEKSITVFKEAVPRASFRSHELSAHLHKHMEEVHPSKIAKSKVIFYTRRSTPGAGGVLYKRALHPQHEADIVTELVASMQRHNRSEDVVIFDGSDGNATMSVRKQFELFSQAKLVIGPHGTGIANVMWMQNGSTCSDRPHVLEFICSTRSVENFQCSPTSIPYKTYWAYEGMAPWVKYHHILFTGNTTPDFTYIDIDDLSLALDAIWTRIRKSENNQGHTGAISKV